jgi:hypothetical protein
MKVFEVLEIGIALPSPRDSGAESLVSIVVTPERWRKVVSQLRSR